MSLMDAHNQNWDFGQALMEFGDKLRTADSGQVLIADYEAEFARELRLLNQTQCLCRIPYALDIAKLLLKD